MKKLLVVSIGLVMVASAHAGLYRWVDDAGNVHFSDKVPAAASKKTHTKFNKSGKVTAKVDPESKIKAINSKLMAGKEKERQAELERIKAAELAISQKRDNDLLSTYSDEDEIVRYFESKIKMVKGNTKILEAQQTVLKKKVVKLENRAANTKQDKMLKNIAKKIVNINKTIERYNDAVIENNEQVVQLSENYESDLARFKELTN